MAKFTFPALLAALGSFSLLASAQTYNTSAPFILQLSSDNANISGQVIGACHSGAAFEVPCLAGNDTTPTSFTTFNFNVSANAVVEDGQFYNGYLVWNLQGGNFNLSEPLTFGATPLDTNVVAPQFSPDYPTSQVAFDDDDKLFIYSSYYDDTKFQPGVFPTIINPVPLYQVSISLLPLLFLLLLSRGLAQNVLPI